MHFKNLIVVFSTILTTSCVFLPKTSDNQYSTKNCKMVTRKLTLEPHISEKYAFCRGESLHKDPIPCLMTSGVIGSASAVVSGSVVLVGNTINWLEHKARCRKTKKS